MSKCKDATVEANVNLLRMRSNVGVAKYGTTLEDSNLGAPALVQHALEEALDLANYLQRLKSEIEELLDVVEHAWLIEADEAHAYHLSCLLKKHGRRKEC